MKEKITFDPTRLMEQAIEVMKASVPEQRADDTITPKVGAVLWKRDGTTVSACRGELREGDHAEYTIIERKNGHEKLGDCALFATLEPCAPDSRTPPKIGCARRITNARIKKVYYGCQDPHPKVAGEGLRYLKQIRSPSSNSSRSPHPWSAAIRVSMRFSAPWNLRRSGAWA
jgi:ATP-dependent DNA helicase RecG